LLWLFWRWDLWNYLLGLTLNNSAPFWASQVARIIGVSYWHPASVGYFWDGILLYVLACLDFDPPICVSLSSWDVWPVPQCPALAEVGGGLTNFYQGWLWTIVLLISDSQVAGIIGMSYHTWLFLYG
jgi:hypothetical protein